jgi:hypothetical protein
MPLHDIFTPPSHTTHTADFKETPSIISTFLYPQEVVIIAAAMAASLLYVNDSYRVVPVW